MTVSRQQSLFAAEDWKIAYRAFSQIDYQAYDFDTMRSAMVDYVRANFPENYNDYIESSEFIAIIELLAYLSQSLAFRMDVNTRENFLETAQRKESVFKLARMLGYNPKRNITASGFLKIVSVKTSEQLTDSLGNDLNNRVVYWDDANNPQSYEQFITVMNAAMSKANRFTAPIKEGKISNIKTELYQINTPIGAPIAYNFDISSNGVTRTYNAVNPDFIDNSNFYERHPDPSNLFNMIYMNDGKGLASKNTGFMVMFRQGVLEFEDFNYTVPVENRQEDIDVENINETDFFLQEVNSSGLVLNKWERIPNTVGQTLNYNSKALNTRNLYAVDTLGSEGVRMRFADGNFGNIPVGIFRAWYRTSDPSRYTIQPEDARNITINIPYVNENGREHTLTIRCSLQYAVSNSQPAESLQAIKDRAPAVYYTQNRMVSAQDYNVFPQSQSNNITKLKAINRTHAGHSRYIDLNDPTGTYHNVDTFADDAYLYIEGSQYTQNIIVNNTTTAMDVVTSVLPQIFKRQDLNNLVYRGLREQYTDPTYGGNIGAFRYEVSDSVTWRTLPVRSLGATGYFTETYHSQERNVLINSVPYFKRLKPNTFCKFVDPTDQSKYKWVRIISVHNSGQLTSGINTGAGPWTLSDEVDDHWMLTETVVTLRKLFTELELLDIEYLIKQRRTFGLGYDLLDDVWYIIPEENLNKTGNLRVDGEHRGPNSWLVLMEYNSSNVANASLLTSYNYRATVRGEHYVVQSADDLKFYNVENVKVVDSNNKSSQDTIVFPTTNTQPSDYEMYEWTGRTWRSLDYGVEFLPEAVAVKLPLKTRDTTWEDIETAWVSNFGIFPSITNSPTPAADAAFENRYVSDAVVELNTYFRVGATTTELNVVVESNTGMINSLPSRIRIPFNRNTFKEDIISIVNGKYAVIYRGLPADSPPRSATHIFVTYIDNNGTPVSHSYGVEGYQTLFNPEINGNLYLISYDENTGEGVLEYRNIQDNDLHISRDIYDNVHRDKLRITYKTNKSKMPAPVYWDVADVFREPDGFTDPRKVKVAPIDSDSDLVPDKPLQFDEFVGPTDLVLFEYYTDYDGYRYNRPVRARIVDIREAEEVSVNNANGTISTGRKTFPISDIDWLIVKNSDIAQQFVGATKAIGMVIHAFNDEITYQVTTTSTQLGNEVIVEETQDHYVRRGRGKTQNIAAPEQHNGTIRWQHVAPNDVRIDPSISNIVEMLVLTSSYYEEVKKWQARPTTSFPLSPTSNELAREFSILNTYKNASDTLVFRSAKFKLLFGEQAADEFKARFRVVRLSDQYSDNEIKTRIIKTINDYFAVNNWEFGETFYFTELSGYIHQQLGSAIGSVVILPKSAKGKFGEMFQVKAEPNELFISTATVNDIEIISRIDNQTLRTDR